MQMRKHTLSLQTIAAGTTATLFLGLSAVAASAHHPMGGDTPQTFAHGLLSGLGHPVIGFDHLAFIIAVGIASAFFAARFALPLLFAAGTAAGCLLFVSGIALPQIEMTVAASVLILGTLVMAGRALPVAAIATLFVAAGLFHGAAYAGEIIGVEATPLIAYILGFCVAQTLIASAAVWMTRDVWQATSAASLKPRLAGAVIAGVGATFLVEHAEKLIFPGL